MGRRCIRLAFSGMVALLGIFVACGGQGATETPMATAVPVKPAPSPTIQVTSTVALSPTPSFTLTPTATPTPAVPTKPTPAVLPQAASLKLEVTTPAEDMVVTSEVIIVSGLTSPDATVSVNGILALPDSQGRFSVDLLLVSEENPLSIEVIATSISGEQRSVVRTVIFVR